MAAVPPFRSPGPGGPQPLGANPGAVHSFQTIGGSPDAASFLAGASPAGFQGYSPNTAFNTAPGNFAGPSPPSGSFKALGAPGTLGSFQAQQPDGSFSALTGPRLPLQQGSFTAGPHAGMPTPAASPQQRPPSPARERAGTGGMRPLKLGSVFGGNAHGHGAECQDQQCAEEECDPEECGDENRAPRDDNYTCGIDRRPLLPVLLVTSTLVGAMQNLVLEFPLLRDRLAGAYWTRGFFLALYTITLGCMAFCLLFDPGQLSEEHREVYAQLQQSGEGGESLGDEPPMPKRCHKAWLYASPIRRYDHFCRWLTNCIGLLNHREFVLMVWGLVTIGCCGGLLDFCLLIMALWEGHSKLELFFLALHLLYSSGLTTLAGPIFRLHVGFVSRNELANEWKRNEYYVVTSLRTGKTVPVNELSDDEFNERFDFFEYDKSKNPWDKDFVSNCLAFWFTPRWAPGQLGEF